MSNETGIHPVEYKVLVKPDIVEKKTDGGIFLPDQTVESEQFAQIRGKIIAVGGDTFPDWKEPIPQVGHRILFSQYSGTNTKGNDGETYWLLQDKDIIAILED